jgi:hypothetical protein
MHNLKLLNSEEVKKIHFNQPQLYMMTVATQMMVAIFGRATGKSRFVTSPWLLRNLLEMPRSCGGLIVPSYEGASKIFSEIYKGWGEFGYNENEHYVVGKRPPASWKRAYNAPKKAKDFQNYVSFYNGSGFYILSNRAKHNGSNLDFLGIEEARLCIEDNVKEVALAVRGNEDKFGHFSGHGSMLFVTDMPQSPLESWVLRYRDNVDHDVISAILMIQRAVYELKRQLNEVITDLKEIDEEETAKRKTFLKKQKKLSEKIAAYQENLNELRRNEWYVHEADTLENIHALGIDTILRFMSTLKPYDFQTSVLNVEPSQVEGGFYALLDENKHGYHAGDTLLGRQLASEHKERDCRFDSDLRDDELYIALDYNQSICTIEVGQFDSTNTFKVINDLEVLPPYDLEDLINHFCKYYQHLKTHQVTYYYDSTAFQGKNAVSDIDYATTVIETFNKNGWIVNARYLGGTTTYASRMFIWSKTLKEDDAQALKFRYNIERCKYLAKSMMGARAGTDFKGKTIKVKKDETNKKIDQRTTTHKSEAMDSLWLGIQQDFMMKQIGENFVGIL